MERLFTLDHTNGNGSETTLADIKTAYGLLLRATKLPGALHYKVIAEQVSWTTPTFDSVSGLGQGLPTSEWLTNALKNANLLIIFLHNYVGIQTWMYGHMSVTMFRNVHMDISKYSNRYMRQSCVEIKGYSVAYFDRFAAFEAPYCWTFVKGGAHMRFIDSLDIHASMKHVWALPLTEVQWYGASNTAVRLKYRSKYTIEIRDGITSDFISPLHCHISVVSTSFDVFSW